MFGKQRKYNKQVLPRLLNRKEFMIRHLRQEWDSMEKATKREDVYRAIKAGGAAVGKGFLVLLLIAGAVTVAAVAPNIFSAFGRARRGQGSHKVYLHRNSFRGEITDLKYRGYIKVEKEGKDEYRIYLTKAGEKIVLQKALQNLKIPKINRWDGVWRMIIFDIPDKHKVSREGFRERLKIMGFYPLQESVFIFPYPCEEEIKFLLYIYNVSDHVRIIETSKITHEDDLRSYFDLK